MTHQPSYTSQRLLCALPHLPDHACDVTNALPSLGCFWWDKLCYLPARHAAFQSCSVCVTLWWRALQAAQTLGQLPLSFRRCELADLLDLHVLQARSSLDMPGMDAVDSDCMAAVDERVLDAQREHLGRLIAHTSSGSAVPCKWAHRLWYRRCMPSVNACPRVCTSAQPRDADSLVLRRSARATATMGALVLPRCMPRAGVEPDIQSAVLQEVSDVKRAVREWVRKLVSSGVLDDAVETVGGRGTAA